MPDGDRPPRNQSWSNMGKMNKTNCVYNYSVPQDMFDANGTEIGIKVGGKARVNVTANSNGTYTIQTCYKKQMKPRRKKRNGSYTNRTSMDNATKEYWNDYNNADGASDQAESVDYYDMEGVHEGKSKRQRGPRRKNDEDGWDGKTINEDKSDWGQSSEDKQYESDPEATTAESGYGKPSKGTYSSELGGYKSFGTVGQGDSPIGAKDTNDTTCGERIVLL